MQNLFGSLGSSGYQGRQVPQGFASSLFGTGGSTPEGYLGQVPDILKKYYAPYEEMYQDPSAILSQLGGGFKASPGYQYSLNQALGAIQRAASAGGMAGTPMQQQEAAQTATGLADQDYYNYLKSALGLYGTGVQGYAGLGENLARNLMTEAQLSQLQQEEAEREEEQENQGFWGDLGSALGGLGGLIGGMSKAGFKL